MQLAKPHIDVGLYTSQRDPMLAFWQQEIGLPYEELLPAGRGVHQHRHGMNGSVLKVNHVRDSLPEVEPTGYAELWIAQAGLDELQASRDPDGNRVVRVPRGTDGVEGIGVRLRVRDEEAFHDFYSKALRLERVGERGYRCGDSLLSFEAHPGAGQGRGYRYITVQVHDVDAEHAAILAAGGTESLAPTTLGKVARISFVRDPDGNSIEISQRASLTGPLS
jgi:lactoylglutathione lyase